MMISRSEDDGLYALCASCNEAVRIDEAFTEKNSSYHADCAGKSRCPDCGEWNDKGKPCPGCGEEGT
jgi:predicted RNA-binding Zn-ribbon protein involved in translation (DUF1610 family)